MYKTFKENLAVSQKRTSDRQSPRPFLIVGDNFDMKITNFTSLRKTASPHIFFQFHWGLSDT